MGATSSTQKRVRKRDVLQANERECHDKFNPNTYQNFETNFDPEASILDTPMYRCYPTDDGRGSNSMELNHFTEISKSFGTCKNQPCQRLMFDEFKNQVEYKDSSNPYDCPRSLDNKQNITNLEKHNYSKDLLSSSFNISSQPIGSDLSTLQINNILIHNTVDSNVYDQTIISVDKAENTQSNSSKVGSLQRNSCVVDNDKKTSSGEQLLIELEESLDCLEEFCVEREVKKTQSLFSNQVLCNSSYATGSNTGIELFSGVKNLKSGKFDHQLSFDVLDILSFPAEWTSCTLDSTGFVDVAPESHEGRALNKLFHRTSVSASFSLQITSVIRIENPFLHSLYMLKKEEMESRNGYVDELYLYHGTKSKNVSQICDDNLNWRLYTERHRFGRGVSFSPSATYSSHYSDSSVEKVMFLFKVLVSNAELGSSDMVIPPIQDSITFDTSIKDDISVVVKYSDNEYYPLYKITYIQHELIR